MPVQFGDDAKAKLDEIHRREEEELLQILSKKYGLPYARLDQSLITTDALRLVPEQDARRAEVAAFALKGRNLSIGIRTPNSTAAKKVIADLEDQGYHVQPHLVSAGSLTHAWVHYKDVSLAIETEAGILDISSDRVSDLMSQLNSVAQTKKAIDDVMDMKKLYRVTRILEITIAGALRNEASDVHVEPEEEYVRFRFRLDGVLTDMAHIDRDTYRALLTRTKLLAGLKININNEAQDGRFSVRVGDRDIEIRTSVLPGGYGENIVLRLLDPNSIARGLEVLGIRPSLLELLKTEIRKPNGMILNTGPTGSGKTTTLYAFLRKVLDPGIKILTIEDPIEYKLEGVQQSQVDHNHYTFAQGLRSALRQDPDIIMVGEIRDGEVASTAVHAALTGHLVFSTLHTNNSSGAYPRLIDMGIDPPMVGSSVNLVMAQRLLRTLHPEKRKEVPIEGKDRAFIDRILENISDKSLIPENTETMWVVDAPEGDPGYKGRVGVYEAIQTTREIEDAVRQKLTIREIEDVARTQGFISMKEDAIIKVLQGVTTLSEVRRILGED